MNDLPYIICNRPIVITYIVIFSVVIFISYAIRDYKKSSAVKTEETVPSAYGLNVPQISVATAPEKREPVPAYQKKWGLEISDEDFHKCLQHWSEINENISQSVEENILQYREVFELQSEVTAKEESLDSISEDESNEHEVVIYPEDWQEEYDECEEDEEEDEEYEEDEDDECGEKKEEYKDPFWDLPTNEDDDMLDVWAYFLGLW